jgi:hypothetical protein
MKMLFFYSILLLYVPSMLGMEKKSPKKGKEKKETIYKDRGGPLELTTISEHYPHENKKRIKDLARPLINHFGLIDSKETRKITTSGLMDIETDVLYVLLESQDDATNPISEQDLKYILTHIGPHMFRVNNKTFAEQEIKLQEANQNSTIIKESGFAFTGIISAMITCLNLTALAVQVTKN